MLNKLIGGLIILISLCAYFYFTFNGPIPGWKNTCYGLPFIGIWIGILIMFPGLIDRIYRANPEEKITRNGKLYQK